MRLEFASLVAGLAAASNVWGYAEQGADWNGTCASAPLSRQSPIAFDTSHMATSEHQSQLIWSYADEPAVRYTIENTGHTLKVSNAEPGKQLNTATLDGEIFLVAQFHFHAPAEHVWVRDDERRPLEMHVVHFSEKDPTKLGVLGVTFVSGDGIWTEADELFSFLRAGEFPPEEPGDRFDFTGHLPLGWLVDPNDKILGYNGSLTTPPCTESVRWFVRDAPIEVSDDVLSRFGPLLRYDSPHGNYRTIQNLPDGVRRGVELIARTASWVPQHSRSSRSAGECRSFGSSPARARRCRCVSDVMVQRYTVPNTL
eukprot:Polyplicarium_translucidae@DN3301_c0_g1_i18.p2